MSPWPDGVALEVFLEAAGLTVPTATDLDALVLAAIDRLKRTAGHGPFLAEGTPSIHRFDPPGPKPTRANPARRGGGTVLILRPSFARIDEVRTGYVSEDDPGELLVRYEDYDFEPADGGQGDKPITRIRFYRTQYGAPASVAVLGEPGYCTDLPDWARQTLLELSGAGFCRQIKPGQATEVVAWQEGDTSERKSIELIQSLGEGWESSGAASLIGFVRLG